MNPRLQTAARIAVVGAGMAGASCARALADAGHRVQLFEKSRGPGGRMATRRLDDWRFDHGAPSFEARTPGFRALCRSWEAQGMAARWTPTLAGPGVPARSLVRWVGRPSMNRLCQTLIDGLTVHWSTRVERLERTRDHRVAVHTAEGREVFDAVVLTLPAPQVPDLLPRWEGVPVEALARVRYRPRWTTMTGLGHEPADVPDLWLGGPADTLAMAVRAASRPGREDRCAWVLHASDAATAAHIDSHPEAMADRMVEAFARDVLGGVLPAVLTRVSHRWRYAEVVEAAGVACLPLEGAPVVLAGDWAPGGGVEGAWQSGVAAARALTDLRMATAC
jgi:predicted NAD/FAD-dependent oxidoreductase